MLDVAFAVSGTSVPREHALMLQTALCAALPWLAQEPLAGIHPLKLVSGTQPTAMLSGRARLLLRVPRARQPELLALADQTLALRGCTLTLGAATLRELQGHSTLYAYRVAAPNADETEFMAIVARELAAMDVRAQQVCGLHQVLAGPSDPLHAFSLMLHGLNEAQALRVLQLGLGAERLLGCGVFVPHKSAAAV